jgi:hypothetical protein
LPTPYMHSWLCYGSFRTAESNEPCRGMSAPARIRSEVDQPVEGSLAENRDTQNSVRIFHRQTAECDSDLSIHALRKGVVYSHRPLFQFADGARSGVPAPSQSDSATLTAGRLLSHIPALGAVAQGRQLPDGRLIRPESFLPPTSATRRSQCERGSAHGSKLIHHLV